MSLRLNIVVAACSNRGIGINGSLPWKLSGDMLFFKRITSETKDPAKQNAVVMGRKTWDSIPTRFRPLPNRINIVISSTLSSATDNVHVARSFDEAINLLSHSEFSQQIEKAFVIGGGSVYKAAFESGLCQRIYLTEVLKDFNCDTFLPEFDFDIYKRIQDPDINDEIQTDSSSGIQFKFVVYQKTTVQDNDHSSDQTSLPLFISVAIDSNRGFGQNGALPWSIKKEFDNFINLISHTSNPGMKVAVIKGRKTWESTSALERSLPSVLNIVISNELSQSEDNVYLVVKSFNEALLAAKQLLNSGIIEKIWVLGGQQVYQDAIDSGLCQKIHLTRIQAEFQCDVHFPQFEDKFDKISCETIEDDGFEMKLEVYERR